MQLSYTGKRRLAHSSTQPGKIIKYTHKNKINPYSVSISKKGAVNLIIRIKY